MNLNRLQTFIASQWQERVTSPLADYIAIPCKSPAFDPDWEAAGLLDRAAEHLAGWAREMLSSQVSARTEVLRLSGKTPAILVDIPGAPGAAPVLIYGHFDKQPELDGWTDGRAPWSAVLEGDRLYGRGGADDGYAIFSSVLAVLGLSDQALACPPCLILIEGSEESGSTDLAAYVDEVAGRMERAPSLIVALDAGAGDYERLWTTTSVRGQVAGVLSVRTLETVVHSGDASGVAPASLRVAIQLLSRLENPETGEIAADFHVPIPPARRAQAEAAAPHADLAASLPFEGRTRAVHSEPVELLLNRAWRPQLTVTGLDGLPSIDRAAAVMQPALALKLGLRLPPTLEPELAAERLKALLEHDPPYGSDVSFEPSMISPGWDAPPLAPWLGSALAEASAQVFGAPGVMFGGGGGIPFLAVLATRFPEAQFLVTGVLGPESNAHGPNEFLHLPTAKRLTTALALVLHHAIRARAGEQP